MRAAAVLATVAAAAAGPATTSRQPVGSDGAPEEGLSEGERGRARRGARAQAASSQWPQTAVGAEAAAAQRLMPAGWLACNPEHQSPAVERSPASRRSCPGRRTPSAIPAVGSAAPGHASSTILLRRVEQRTGVLAGKRGTATPRGPSGQRDLQAGGARQWRVGSELRCRRLCRKPPTATFWGGGGRRAQRVPSAPSAAAHWACPRRCWMLMLRAL